VAGVSDWQKVAMHHNQLTTKGYFEISLGSESLTTKSFDEID